jgi:hypothetical protein
MTDGRLIHVDNFEKRFDSAGEPWFLARYPTPTERRRKSSNGGVDVLDDADALNADALDDADALNAFNLYQGRHCDKVGNKKELQHRRCDMLAIASFFFVPDQ